MTKLVLKVKLKALPPNKTKKTLSHLSAHVINRLLRENQKSIQNVFNGKKLFKNVTHPDFKFYLGKLNNKKKFPYGAMLIWCMFSLH